MSDVEALAQTPPPRKPDYVFHCMREEIEKLMEEDGRTGTRHLVDQLMSLAWPPPSASAAMPDEVTITRARYEAYKAAEARALAAEGLLEEARGIVGMWVSWCDGPALPHPYDQLEYARAFLRRMEERAALTPTGE